MSDPSERHHASSVGRALQFDDNAQRELAALRAQIERLMERATPVLAGAADDAADHAHEVGGAAEGQSEARTAVDTLPGAFNDAMDELMGGFDGRLAEVNRRLDRVLERRR